MIEVNLGLVAFVITAVRCIITLPPISLLVFEVLFPIIQESIKLITAVLNMTFGFAEIAIESISLVVIVILIIWAALPTMVVDITLLAFMLINFNLPVIPYIEAMLIPLEFSFIYFSS